MKQLKRMLIHPKLSIYILSALYIVPSVCGSHSLCEVMMAQHVGMGKQIGKNICINDNSQNSILGLDNSQDMSSQENETFRITYKYLDK